MDYKQEDCKWEKLQKWFCEKSELQEMHIL